DTTEFLDSVERREQRADSRAVARLLMPRTIAVIGASERAGTVGAAVWSNVRAGATGPVYAVNPAHGRVGDQTCYRSITDVPDDVQLAVVTVPSSALVATIDDCIAARVRGAVVITSIEGSDIDLGALIARARRNGLRIVGPGSMGVASSRPEVGLNAALVPVRLPAGRLAISMQSGSLGASLLAEAARLGMGLSWFVSLGDKSDISGNDLLQFWSDDDHTRVIGMYTESFGNPKKFVRIASRVSRTRPIVAVRAGSAIGPTGSALYQQAGLIEVPTVQALLDTTRVLVSQPVPAGPNVAVIGNAHSPVALASAALAAAGLTPHRRGRHLDFSSPADEFGRVLASAIGDDGIDAIIVVHAPPLADDVALPLDELERAAADSPKPILAVLLGAADGSGHTTSSLPVFVFPEPAAAVLGRMYAYHRWLADDRAEDTATTAVVAIDRPRAAALIETALARGDEHLRAGEALQLLGCYGIPTPPTVTVARGDAVDAARDVGFPVAVKAAHRRVGRSVQAGVALDLTDADDVSATISTMADALGDGADEVTVQRMVAPGLDLRIATSVDDPIGAIVAVGLGGQGTDLLTDEPTRLAPLSAASAGAMIDRSRAGAALASAGIDPEPMEDVLVRAAQLAADHPAVVRLELNPVLVSTNGVWVTDAEIDIAPRRADAAPLRRLE
ncbi:MAG: acetate--CoA ligase family protein, partial [Desertimonas sp.]